MKHYINFSDQHGNETDEIEVIIGENNIEIPNLDFNGTLSDLYKTHGIFIETGTVSLPVGKRYPKGGIFSMKKLLKLVGVPKEEETVPETTCFILSQDNKLIYIGDYNQGIVERATTYVKRAKKTLSLYHNGQPPVVFPYVA